MIYNGHIVGKEIIWEEISVYPITFQVAGLMLIFLIFAMMKKQQTLRLYSESVYMSIVSLVLGCICLDILSVIAIIEVEYVGKIFQDVSCKLYLFFAFLVTHFLLGYIIAETRRTPPDVLRNILINGPFILTEVFALIFTDVHAAYQDGKIYISGICVYVTYVIAVLYLFAGLYHLIHRRKQVTAGRVRALSFLIASWILAAGIQFIWKQVMLIGFAMAFAMLIMYLALEDPQNNLDRVTGTFNGHALNTYLEKVIHSGNKFQLLSLEIGGMKFINENFGIKNGSTLQQMVGSFLGDICVDRVFHTAENEFTVILPEKTDINLVLEQLHQKFNKSWKIREVSFNLDAYIVVLQDSTLLSDREDILEVLHYFMVECRKFIRGAVIKIDEKAMERRSKVSEAEKALRWAIQNDKVQVFYQPIYSNEEGKFNSLEALVRISDEESNFVMPDLFIPIAENNGLILELGIIVFRKVCQFLSRAHLEKLGIEYVEVNLSVVQCMQAELADQLLEVMAEYQIPPFRINFEITETTAVNSEKTLLRNMDNLCGVGSNFSLDDYGSGYSNLSYVVELPLNIVKLDKSMVWSFFYSEKAKVAVRSIIRMVHELGMKVVAEGVETKEQFLTFKELDVDYIQGFYFSQPIPGSEVEGFLAKWL